MTLRERTAAERYVQVGPDELIVRRGGARAWVLDRLEDGVVLGEPLPRPLVARAEGKVTGALLDPEVELLGLERRVEREVVERVVRADLEVRRQQRVVLHVLANIGKVDDGFDAERIRLSGGANAGEQD